MIGLGWIAAVWKARQRAIDLQILWPSLREQAESLGYARFAFRAHMEMDPAYSDMTEAERDSYAQSLPE